MVPLTSTITAYDEHRGYRYRPNLRDQSVCGAPLATNSLGVRGKSEYPVPRAGSGPRVIALGDSLTFGEGVADDETWPAQLQASMPGSEVANFGMPGFAHDQMYFAFVDQARALRPDAVILGFYDNDLRRDEQTFYCYEKPRFSKGDAGWFIENVPVPAPAEVRGRDLLVPLVYAVPRMILDVLMPPGDGEERAAEIFRRLSEQSRQIGARFIIVNLPSHPADSDRGNPFIYEYCDASHDECVDTWPAFRHQPEAANAELFRARFLRGDGIHYTPAGYAVVAEELRKYFVDHPIAHARKDHATATAQ
jgi:lysophospholipase L1-like esterase